MMCAAVPVVLCKTAASRGLYREDKDPGDKVNVQTQSRPTISLFILALFLFCIQHPLLQDEHKFPLSLKTGMPII